MTDAPRPEFTIRPLQYRNRDSVGELLAATDSTAERSWLTEPLQRRIQLGDHHPMRKVLEALPGRWSSTQRTFIAEQAGQLVGLIQVSPFNQSRSTWRVEQLCISPAVLSYDVGTQLIRHCLESIWEARTWLVEVEINHTDALGLYRQNGFQPLAQLTQWQIPSLALTELTAKQPSLPNLLPINNADAALLYQLDTAAMPPFVRQVFDRHVQDFQRSVFSKVSYTLQTQLRKRDWINGYVFEPQRKAAIGYFAIYLSKGEQDAHVAQMTVHPAYTWLYSELLTHMAQLSNQSCATAPMNLISADYQAEREDYLEQIGAERVEHTLMLSRSVWHKVKESKTISLETLQLTEMLQGLQPNQTPVPGRMMMLRTTAHSPLKDKRQP